MAGRRPEDKDRLRRRALAGIERELDPAARRRRREAAAAARAQRPAAPTEPPRQVGTWSDEELADLPTFAKHRGRRGEALRSRLERLRGPVSPPAAAPGEAPGLAEPALVVAVERGRCLVEVDGELRPARLSPALAALQQSELAVGDEVAIARSQGESVRIERLLPRRSFLSRPDPSSAWRERLIAANVDQVVIVAALYRPPLRPGLIDRYLVAIARGGAQPIVCANKLDLASAAASDDPEIARLSPYRELGLPVVLCSAADGRGVAELTALLAGTVVFVGHSGVGKSSLLNAIEPGLGLATSEVSAFRGTGRHTTRRSTVFRLASGLRLIDTPGIREFGLWRLTRAEIAEHFGEFDEAARACRFADCTHSHEPSCGVRRAAEEGEIASARYRSYLRLLGELEAER